MIVGGSEIAGERIAMGEHIHICAALYEVQLHTPYMHTYIYIVAKLIIQM